MRVLQQLNDTFLYVCGTNAFQPTCDYLVRAYRFFDPVTTLTHCLYELVVSLSLFPKTLVISVLVMALKHL